MALDIHLTSTLMWRGTLIAAILDALLLSIVVRLAPPATFRKLKWSAPVVTAVVYAGLWAWVLWGSFWDLVYGYLFHPSARWLGPPAYGLLFGLAAAGFWRLALRLPGNPVVTFCVLGGLASLPGHLFAIYGRHMFELVPMLRGVSPLSALVFGIFEFIFYWSVITLIAVMVDRVYTLSSGRSKSHAARAG
jgi:hypothetical protein